MENVCSACLGTGLADRQSDDPEKITMDDTDIEPPEDLPEKIGNGISRIYDLLLSKAD